MSNIETRPREMVCGEATGRDVELLDPREVPLGGPRAMRVRRTLPQRRRSLVGAWCFADHYGPESVSSSGGMSVPPHPHTGLQTVSWLFAGTVEHRDSAGNRALVRPGELNLMTAGSGISHSEYSTPDTDVLHGAQLWVALPDAARFTDRRFDHYAPPTVTGPGWRARVFLGHLLGSTSPVDTHTPLLGAEVGLDAGSSLDVDLDREFEHGVLVDLGHVEADGSAVGPGQLAYLPPGSGSTRLEAGPEPARLLVLGGPPFGEQIVMWWNFVARSHEEIVELRAAWQAEIGAEPSDAGSGRFGLYAGDPEPPLPAPALPNARLRPRS
ncbi:MAG: pirin family protein [Marmoricola sp.]